MGDSLSKEQAVRAVAQMLNTLAVEPVEALLADEIHYEVQWHLHGPSGVWLPFDFLAFVLLYSSCPLAQLPFLVF